MVAIPTLTKIKYMRDLITLFDFALFIMSITKDKKKTNLNRILFLV